MMLANDLKTYYDEVRRYLDCPKDEQDRLLLSVNKQVIELQVDNPNLDYDGIVEFLGEPESLAASLMERLSPDVVQKFKKKKRRLRLSIIACVAVVVVALSTLTIYTTTRQSNVHITEENYTFVDDNKVDDNKNVLDCSATSFLRNWDSILEKKRANLRSISEPARLRQPPPRSTGSAHARGRAQSIREERRIAAPPVLFALLWVRLLSALYGPFCGPLRPFGGCPQGVTPPP